MDVCWHQHRVNKNEVSYKAMIRHDAALSCQGCGGLSCEDRVQWVYQCNPQCKVTCHVSCAPPSMDDIELPWHFKHPLELMLAGPPVYSDGKCNRCQGKLNSLVYHCKSCDFSVHPRCAYDPLPLTAEHPKCHEHPLTLLGAEVSFTCNACGMSGAGYPYVCLPCSLVFHQHCLDRPHVININRHEHRISHHSRPLSPGDHRSCEICRQGISWRYGAYSCNKCPYFVHTRCATSRDVWDGKELRGVPEEEIDIAPFKVMDEGQINHKSHEEHDLFLIEDVIIDGRGEDMLCQACSHPISFERYYNCMECKFMLHEKCANLPLQKRHWISTGILSLNFGKEKEKGLFLCSACRTYASGFRYEEGDITLDVGCASLFWFRHRKLHPHTLYFTTKEKGSCVGCYTTEAYVLHCTESKYTLGFSCATLPVVIKHTCDDHYLFLSSGEKVSGKYWCEVCEAELDPKKWFYTCHDCGVVCHTNCVTGDSLNIRPGLLDSWEVILNNHNTRPICSSCGSRCRFPKVFKDNGGRVHCSLGCYIKTLWTF